mgnify:FL=1
MFAVLHLWFNNSNINCSYVCILSFKNFYKILDKIGLMVYNGTVLEKTLYIAFEMRSTIQNIVGIL